MESIDCIEIQIFWTDEWEEKKRIFWKPFFVCA